MEPHFPWLVSRNTSGARSLLPAPFENCQQIQRRHPSGRWPFGHRWQQKILGSSFPAGSRQRRTREKVLIWRNLALKEAGRAGRSSPEQERSVGGKETHRRTTSPDRLGNSSPVPPMTQPPRGRGQKGVDIHIYMNFVWLSVLLLLLQSPKSTSQRSHSYWILKPNVLVVDINLNISAQTLIELKCGDAFEGQQILWRNEGRETSQRGNRVQVVSEEMMGGNYTCHDQAGRLLNYTLVLVRAEGSRQQRKILDGVATPWAGSKNVADDRDYIQCTSKNYSGAFHCWWRWSARRRGSVVSVSAVRSSSVSDILCSLDSDQSGVTCLDRLHCPYAEEANYITLTVYVRYWYRVEKYFRQFYITEIVKPDKIAVEKTNESTVNWTYPMTWSLPRSYFPLTFQVKVVPQKKHCNYEAGPGEVQVNLTEEQGFPVNYRRKKITFCVRAQDTFTKSSWSDWSKTEIKKANMKTARRERLKKQRHKQL
ncbi:interleukin-12 subunit beta-like isoform X1 [Paramormyrops kingsleyae]|uniref:interleukin-12 subunit beta-like isoform X1 n=1 Tax=Paramormyrops kingsleyae TaxID=1676925 RepID=UPI003B97207C